MAAYRTIVAYFPSHTSAQSAMSALIDAGFNQSQFGMAARSTAETKDHPGTAYEAGAKAGGAWNALKSFFGGNEAEPYAGEASRENLNDRVITPENYGSEDVHSSLAGLSVPDEHARYFGHRLGSDAEGAVISVNTEGREDEAIAIIKANGGDVGEDADKYDYGTGQPPVEAQNLQLFGEVLRVHKDRVSRGEVRLRKEVHTTTQTVEVPVTREELVLERVPVAGQQAATGAAFSGEEIRIPLSEERASVEKQAVVREEVRVGKKEVTGTKTFDEQVRREDLKVESTSTSEKI